MLLTLTSWSFKLQRANDMLCTWLRPTGLCADSPSLGSNHVPSSPERPALSIKLQGETRYPECLAESHATQGICPGFCPRAHHPWGDKSHPTQKCLQAVLDPGPTYDRERVWLSSCLERMNPFEDDTGALNAYY